MTEILYFCCEIGHFHTWNGHFPSKIGRFGSKIHYFCFQINRFRSKIRDFWLKLGIFQWKSLSVDIINTIWAPQITDIAWNITSIWDIDIKEMKTSADIGSKGILWGLDRFWYAKIIWFIASYSEYQKILWLVWRLYAKFFSLQSYSQILDS